MRGVSMYILLSALKPSPVISLEEPDDCTRFHLDLHALGEAEARLALERADVGWLDDENAAWITIASLRRWAQGRVSADWPERFEKMLRYAEHKGWLSQDRTMIKGHCEW